MTVSRLAVSAACLALSCGTAQAATFTFEDTVARNTSATYVFDLHVEAVRSGFLENETIYFLDGIGPGGFGVDHYHDYLGPDCYTANCARTDFIGDSYVSIYSNFYNDKLTIRVESKLIEFDTCFEEGSPLFCSLQFTGDPGFYLTATYSGDVGGVSITRGAVPEPATWAMMIVGFGLVGSTLRRRRLEIA